MGTWGGASALALPPPGGDAGWAPDPRWAVGRGPGAQGPQRLGGGGARAGHCWGHRAFPSFGSRGGGLHRVAVNSVVRSPRAGPAARSVPGPRPPPRGHGQHAGGRSSSVLAQRRVHLDAGSQAGHRASRRRRQIQEHARGARESGGLGKRGAGAGGGTGPAPDWAAPCLGGTHRERAPARPCEPGAQACGLEGRGRDKASSCVLA